jgi:hypothetical protein
LLIHVSVGRWSIGVVGFIVMDVSVSAVTTALLLSVRSGLAIFRGCFSHASCKLRLELASIGVRKTVRPGMVGLWMEGTLVLITVALTVVTAATAIVTAASIVVTIAVTVTVVSTVTGVVAGTVVVVVSGRASKIGQNLHEVDEFLSGCSRRELLSVSNERRLIVRTLTAKEGFLNVLFSRQRIRTRHHRRVLDERIESKEESSRLHIGWDVSTTRSNVGNERRSIHVGTNRGCDACFDRVILSVDKRTGCWKAENRLLVDLVIVGIENRLKVGNLVAERHSQSVSVSLEGSKTKEIGLG